MENMIPLNGRIAIVDDRIDQALPLIRIFSKNNIPYVFYKGVDMDYLPEQPENDIRILFLDLNLLDGRNLHPKEIRSTLYSLISRIISPSNYPYVIILWSLQEKEYRDLLEELFNNELKRCAPIAITNWIKPDFFSIETEEEVNKENEYKIFDELKNFLSTMPAYSYLMQWENCVHNSADATLQNVFHDFHTGQNWENNANCIMNMFAKSYLEQRYSDSTNEDKAKASLLFLDDVYYDIQEASIVNGTIENATDLQSDIDKEQLDIIKSKINEKLLVSKFTTSVSQPGCVLVGVDESAECNKCAYAVLNDSLNTEDLRNQVKEKFQDTHIADAKKYYNQLLIERKDKIKTTLLPCGVVVTPACDFAQNKAKYDRIVLGVIIDACFRDFIDNKSEAVYISPVFNNESQKRILVLNFRYFYTEKLSHVKNITAHFRIRNSILSEIQSKLARHINRQGIMNL